MAAKLGSLHQGDWAHGDQESKDMVDEGTKESEKAIYFFSWNSLNKV